MAAPRFTPTNPDTNGFEGRDREHNIWHIEAAALLANPSGGGSDPVTFHEPFVVKDGSDNEVFSIKDNPNDAGHPYLELADATGSAMFAVSGSMGQTNVYIGDEEHDHAYIQIIANNDADSSAVRGFTGDGMQRFALYNDGNGLILSEAGSGIQTSQLGEGSLVLKSIPDGFTQLEVYSTGTAIGSDSTGSNRWLLLTDGSGLTILSSGGAQHQIGDTTVGFFGATPVGQSAHGTTAAHALACLIAFGFMAAS